MRAVSCLQRRRKLNTDFYVDTNYTTIRKRLQLFFAYINLQSHEDTLVLRPGLSLFYSRAAASDSDGSDEA